MTMRRRRRNMDPALQKFIEDRANDAWSATDIYRQLQKSGPPDLPTLRTVQNVVRDAVRRDKSGPWSVADKDKDGNFLYTPEDTRVILDVLADITLHFGRKRGFTKEEAKWVVRLSKLAPELPHDTLWNLARSYLKAESKGESTETLDMFVAFKPWKSENRRDNYRLALERGLVKEDPDGWWVWIETWCRGPSDFDTGCPENRAPAIVDTDHVVVRDALSHFTYQEGRMLTDAKKRRQIREQDPDLDKRIRKALEKGERQRSRISEEWRKRIESKEPTKKDQNALHKALSATWHEYFRLLDSFDEENDTNRNKKDGES